MFSLKGEYIVQLPLDVARIAVPLVIYFLLMFLVTFYMSARPGQDIASAPRCRLPRQHNFELAIAGGRSGFWLQSGEALPQSSALW